MKKFELIAPFTPTGDQPAAIDKLIRGVKGDKKAQVLLGVTGSGKTFTMANIIASCGKPALILAHNKTLAAQLYQEFKAFFPNNAVEYFVSYYDYYQPEAYIARTDTYIEKDLAINDQIDRMRLSATRSLMEREDVIIVSSVSCIYGLGLPEYYAKMKLDLEVGKEKKREDLLHHLISMRYERNDLELSRGSFRVRGDSIEIMPAYDEQLAYRIELFGDDIETISEIDPLTCKKRGSMSKVVIFPATHHVTPEDVKEGALASIRLELKERLAELKEQDKLVEWQRLQQRTSHDIEMIREIGFCKGIENYSRHFSDRKPGDTPPCLIDYFPKDFLFFIDESHQTIPQVNAMYNGDRARKESLISFGFRLPSAFDNRPLKFEEFYEKINQVIYVSATPAPFEINEAGGEIIEQIIRPTGLLDPEIEIRPADGQIDDCIAEIQKNVAAGGRVLVTTLTKKLSEELSKYLLEAGLKAKYLHSDIETLERIQIINDLRKGHFDVLVGINLLREGLDIPEVSLVTILDADKEGFLRSETALIQTCGRAARNTAGRVIMYADKITKSIDRAKKITEKRREIQKRYNEEHHITPRSTKREFLEEVSTLMVRSEEEDESGTPHVEGPLTARILEEKIADHKKKMKSAALALDFEEAAKQRDLLRHFEQLRILE